MSRNIESRLSAISQRLRTAFAAGCAQRVLKIFEYNAASYSEGPERAVDLAWDFACGDEIDPSSSERIGKAAANAAPSVDEMGSEFTPAMNAALSAAYSVDSISDPTSRYADLSAKCALDAVNSFDLYRGEGVAEEEQWQRLALEILEDWGSRSITRDMFNNISKKTPIWMRDWE